MSGLVSRPKRGWIVLGALLAAAGCEEAPVQPPLDHLDPVGAPEPTRPACDVNPDFAVTVNGHVFDRTGAPTPGVRIGVWREAEQRMEHVATSDARGVYTFDNATPAPVRLLDWEGGVPSEYCGGVPGKFRVEVPEGSAARMLLNEHNFIAPDLCLRELVIPPLDGVDAVEVLIARRALGRSLGRWAVGQTHLLRVPCDADGVAAVGAGHRSTAGAAVCGTLPGYVCWSDQGPTVLRWEVTAPVTGLIHGPDGAPLVGAEVVGGIHPVRAGADGRFETWIAGDRGWLGVRAPGRVPSAALEVAEGGLLKVALEPGRTVGVRCEGLHSNRCTALPVVDLPDGPRPCRWDQQGLARCELPADRPAVVRTSGAAVEVPVEATQAWFSYADVPGEARVRATTTPSCQAWAWREVDGFTRWWEHLTDAPRLLLVRGRCDPDDEVVFAPLTEGRWRLEVLTPEGWTTSHAEVAGPPR